MPTTAASREEFLLDDWKALVLEFRLASWDPNWYRGGAWNAPAGRAHVPCEVEMA